MVSIRRSCTGTVPYHGHYRQVGALFLVGRCTVHVRGTWHRRSARDGPAVIGGHRHCTSDRGSDALEFTSAGSGYSSIDVTGLLWDASSSGPGQQRGQRGRRYCYSRLLHAAQDVVQSETCTVGLLYALHCTVPRRNTGMHLLPQTREEPTVLRSMNVRWAATAKLQQSRRSNNGHRFAPERSPIGPGSPRQAPGPGWHGEEGRGPASHFAARYMTAHTAHEGLTILQHTYYPHHPPCRAEEDDLIAHSRRPATGKRQGPDQEAMKSPARS